MAKISSGVKLLFFPGADVDLDLGLGLLLDHLEVVELLDRLVLPLSADQSLGVEHGVLGVAGQLVIGSISDLVQVQNGREID